MRCREEELPRVEVPADDLEFHGTCARRGAERCLMAGAAFDEPIAAFLGRARLACFMIRLYFERQARRGHYFHASFHRPRICQPAMLAAKYTQKWRAYVLLQPYVDFSMTHDGRNAAP